MLTEGAICDQDLTALQQLKFWHKVKRYWCEDNPSVTIMVRKDEWPSVGAFLYKNWEHIGGLSFLPLAELAPFEKITAEHNFAQMQAPACTGSLCQA